MSRSEAWLVLRTGLFDKCAVAGIGIDDLRWLMPVREGDTVRLELSLLEATPSRCSGHCAPGRIKVYGYAGAEELGDLAPHPDA